MASDPVNLRAKIAFVNSIFDDFRTFHMPYMEWFLQQGWAVHAYANRNAPEQAHSVKVLEDMGVCCHHVPIMRSPLQFANVSAYRVLFSAFSDQQFDLVHLHTPVAAVLGRLAAKRANVPCVLYTAHGFHFFKGAPWQNWLLYYPVERLLSRLTDFLITINLEDQRRAEGFPVRKQVYFVPGVGVPIEEFSSLNALAVRREVRGLAGVAEDAFVFLCVAELNENKNHTQLLQAIERIVKEHGFTKVRCWLLGRGDREANISDEIAARGLQNVVQLLGYRLDVPRFITAADAVVLLSHREGLPRALLEGMAAGKPLIVTDVRGCRDLVVAEENGYLVPVDGIEQTTDACLNLLENRTRAERMGYASLKLCEPYHLDAVLQRMQVIYLEAMEYAAHKKDILFHAG